MLFHFSFPYPILKNAVNKTQPIADLGEEEYLTVLMHNIIFVISAIPVSSRQRILYVWGKALLELRKEEEITQGRAKPAVISYQNKNQTIKKVSS